MKILGAILTYCCLLQVGLCSLDQTQVNALKDLGAALNMPDYSIATLATACRLPGVTCSASAPRVLGTLSLQGRNLSGTLPNSIGNLIDLKNLDLSNNYITGTLPSTVGNVLGLTLLRVDSNNFTGEFPTLSLLSNLTVLRVDKNTFNGSIPDWLGNLTKLTVLVLGDNNFEGELPTSLANLKSLTSLQLDDNYLSGTLPSWLGDMTALQELSLKGNGFFGPIPQSIERLTNLTTLKLLDNFLNGTIPSFLGNSKLQNLILSNNKLTGNIPAFTQSVMFWLILDGNELTGTVPKLPNSMTLLQFQNNVGLSGCFNQNFTFLLGCSVYNTSMCCAPERCKGDLSKCVVTEDTQIEGTVVVTTIEFSQNSSITMTPGSSIYINGSGCQDLNGDLVVEVDFSQLNATDEYDLMTYACYTGQFDTINIVYENQDECDQAEVVYQNTKLTLLVTPSDTCQQQNQGPQVALPDYAIALIVCLPIVVAAAVVVPIMIVRRNKLRAKKELISSRVRSTLRTNSQVA